MWRLSLNSNRSSSFTKSQSTQCQNEHLILVTRSGFKNPHSSLSIYKSSLLQPQPDLLHPGRPSQSSSAPAEVSLLSAISSRQLSFSSSSKCPSKKSRPGDRLVSSRHTSPLFEKASVLPLGWLAGSVQGPDRIFLFAQRQGCLSISATSGGGLSGLLITMFSPALFPSLMVCYTSKWESRLGLSCSSSLQSYATPCKQDWLSLLLPLSHVCVCVCV